MQVVLYTAPTIEPITLTELKLHLRLDSNSFADSIDETISIVPGSHAIANNYTTHIGTAKEVLGYTAVVVAQYGVLVVGGVVDIKVQESDDNATWTDWATGAFTQVTIAAASSTQEKAYTGTKRYIRTVARVVTQASEFSTTVIRLTSTTYEDDDLNDAIIDGREEVEKITRRKLLTQTWDYYLNAWPSENYIKLPFGNLQSNAKATGTITSSGVNVSVGDRVTIDTKVYTFTGVPAVEGEVDIGITAAESLDHLKAAINHTGTPGVDYVCANAHPTVEATTNTDTTQTLESILGGVAGNLIALTTTAVTYSVSAATLTGGITSARIQYWDTDGVATEIDVTTDYEMEFNGEQCGRIVLPYGVSWPTVTLRPSNPIQIRFYCGWTTAALVPKNLKRAVKFAAENAYYHGDRSDILIPAINNLTNHYRLWDEF